MSARSPTERDRSFKLQRSDAQFAALRRNSHLSPQSDNSFALDGGNVNGERTFRAAAACLCSAQEIESSSAERLNQLMINDKRRNRRRSSFSDVGRRPSSGSQPKRRPAKFKAVLPPHRGQKRVEQHRNEEEAARNKIHANA